MPFDTLRNFPNVLVVKPATAIHGVKDLVAQAKAEPGVFDHASSGNGSAQHLAGERFYSMAGVKISHMA